MNAIANGSKEATVPNLRDDLEQYGGTNDITFERGDEKSGLEHIALRHGHKVIPGVLDTVIEGKILRYLPSNQTVILRSEQYEAVLSLNKHGTKKTWLLTGYELLKTAQDHCKGFSDGHGKFSPRHMPTHTGPMFSRSAMGAENPLPSIIEKIFVGSNRIASLDARDEAALIADIKTAILAEMRRARQSLPTQDAAPVAPRASTRTAPLPRSGPFAGLARIRVEGMEGWA